MSPSPIEKQRERVKDAHVAYLFACHYTAEIRREDEQWGALPTPDGGYRYRQAIAHEIRKLQAYTREIRILREMTTSATGQINGCA